MSEVPGQVAAWARDARRVTVLTGAGMSAESGVPTFRDAQTGLWARYDPAELATPEAWERDPALVWAWYAWRRTLVRRAEPHAGHRALARWQRRAPVRIVTQNVDDLHERAGAHVLTHLHGDLFADRCSVCHEPWAGRAAADQEPGRPAPARVEPPACPGCGGPVRPGVVWFGEALPEGAFDTAVQAVRDADLVLVVGTSGLVHPAAALPDLAGARGVPVVEVNPEPSAVSGSADLVWRSTASHALPALVDALGEVP